LALRKNNFDSSDFYFKLDEPIDLGGDYVNYRIGVADFSIANNYFHNYGILKFVSTSPHQQQQQQQQQHEIDLSKIRADGDLKSQIESLLISKEVLTADVIDLDQYVQIHFDNVQEIVFEASNNTIFNIHQEANSIRIKKIQSFQNRIYMSCDCVERDETKTNQNLVHFSLVPRGGGGKSSPQFHEFNYKKIYFYPINKSYINTINLKIYYNINQLLTFDSNDSEFFVTLFISHVSFCHAS
jgi:hypothetical protein